MKKGVDNFNSKNLLLLVSSVFIFVVAVSMISATYGFTTLNGEGTIVEGNVFYENTNEPIANANMKIVCNHNNGVRKTVQNTKTDSEGYYSVGFNRAYCDESDIATVTAKKTPLKGIKKTVVEEDEVVYGTLMKYADVTFTQDIVVPEFGTVIGIVTLLGALGVFFVIRRK